MSESGEKTLEQMLMNLRAEDIKKERIELSTGFGGDWVLRISHTELNGFKSISTTRTYVASTPMGAVVQAYRDR